MQEETEDRAVQVGLFWTTTDGFVSRTIRRVIGGNYSHVGLVVLLEGGTAVYYEALAGRGIVGPRLLSALEVWSYEPGRLLEIQWAWWLHEEQAEIIHQRAIALQAAAGYGTLQLLGHWWFERVRKHLGGRMRNTPGKVTCSEFVSRAFYPDVKLFDDHRDHHDAVTPKSCHTAFRRIEHAIISDTQHAPPGHTSTPTTLRNAVPAVQPFSPPEFCSESGGSKQTKITGGDLLHGRN